MVEIEASVKGVESRLGVYKRFGERVAEELQAKGTMEFRPKSSRLTLPDVVGWKLLVLFGTFDAFAFTFDVRNALAQTGWF